MEQTTDRVTRERERPRVERSAAGGWLTARGAGFTNLERALNDAEDAATATRSLAARSLGA